MVGRARDALCGNATLLVTVVFMVAWLAGPEMRW